MLLTIALPLFFLATAASFIQRVSGFGFGIFIMMFLPFFLPSFGEAITLSGLLAGTTSLLIAVRNWRYIRWRIMGVIFVTNIVTAGVAITYLADVSSAAMKRGLGAVLIVIALYFLFFQGRRSWRTSSWKAQATVGAISGFTGGVFAMPGPPIVLYCIQAFDNKREYIATLQALFCCSNVCYTLFRARVGFFTPNTVYYWGIGLAGLVVGTLVGARCFEHISGGMLKRIVYVMMVGSGLVALLG